MKRLFAIMFSLPVGIILLCAGCAALGSMFSNALGMEYVPDAKTCERWGPEFIVRRRSPITGLYANQDVPCVLYRYETKSPDPIADIARGAADRGWRCVMRDTDQARFERWEKSRADFGGYEAHVRVNRGRVYVAQVAGSSGSRLAQVAQTNHGGWAVHALWPKLDEYAVSGR